MGNSLYPDDEQRAFTDTKSLRGHQDSDDEYCEAYSSSEEIDGEPANLGPTDASKLTKPAISSLSLRQIDSSFNRSKKGKRSTHNPPASLPTSSADGLSATPSATRRYAHVADFCVDCVCLVETVIVEGQQFSRALGNFKTLEQSAKSCLLCNMFLLILKGKNGSVLTQAKAYDDASFNLIDRYDENGISDVEELSNPTTRVKVSLHATRIFTNTSEWVGCEPCIGLLLVFEVHFNTQSLRGRESCTSPAESKELQNAIAVIKSEGKFYFFAFALGLTESSVIEDGNSVMTLRVGDTRLDGDRKLDHVKRWLCDTNDKTSEMRRKHANEQGPARLLKICSEEEVQLVELDYDTSPATPAYLALSHRWGRRQHLTTTCRNIAAHKAQIHLNDLPGTFRDAITITRLLGYLYIWIDALCIIQDSASDWHNESQKMGDIFQGASITLAVHCAKDDFEGFLNRAFAKRPVTEYRTKYNQISFFQPPNPEEDVTGSALSRRAWVLQERFLSTRTIHFTAGQIYLENTDGIFCEDGFLYQTQRVNADSYELHSDGSERLGSSHLSPSAVPFLRTALGFDIYSSTTTGSVEWLPLVEMYTRCGLTKESDKLVALSGMARRIGSRTKAAWCAGIWDNNLVQGMLWLGELGGLSAPTTPRAPSWSWAAWDGPIQHPQPVLAGRCTPRVSFVVLKDTEHRMTSWLNGPGYLTLYARLIPLNNLSFGSEVVLGPGPPRPGPYTGGKPHLPRLRLLHFIRAQGLIWRSKKVKGLPGGMENVGWVTFDDPDVAFIRNAKGPPPLWFVVLATHGAHGPSTPATLLTYLGIFVIRSSPLRPIYERVGFGQMSYFYLFNSGDGDKMSHYHGTPDEDFFHDEKYTEIILE